MADEFPRGQISTLILMCLTNSDMYGYEIIDAVLTKTNGKVSIKQPSLYSSLKRMEEQALISSYWRDSEIGGRRHYYHLTDLGKKHLEKWQTNLSLPALTENKEPENINTTKVLHQQNLFSLSSEQNKEESEKQNELIVNNPEPASFLQYGFFEKNVSNSTTVETNISDNFSINEDITQISKQEPNHNEDCGLKTYSFDYVKKGNKSFSDTIKNKNNYESKFNIFEQSKNNEKLILDNTNEEPDKTEVIHKEQEDNLNIPTLVETNGTSINKINIEDLDGYIKPNNTNSFKTTTPSNIQKEIKIEKDDGVFITERLDVKDLPKQPKFEARKFEVYISDTSLTPKFSEKHSENYEDRVKDLYEKSKTNAENVELELIDSKLKFYSYKDLKDFYSEQNIKFKPFQKSLYKSEKKFDMIKINKLNMLTSLFVLGFVSILSLILGIVLSLNKTAYLNSPITFISLPALCLVFVVLNFVIYEKSPQKRIAFDINKFKFNETLFILSICIIPIIFAINLFAGFNFTNFAVYSISLIYPSIVSLIYLMCYISRRILIKLKMLY